jgi:ribosomal protein S27AE
LSKYDIELLAKEREEYLHRKFNVANNPMYINMSIGKGKFGASGKDHPLFGKKGNKCANFGIIRSFEVREFESLSRMGEGNPMYGRNHSEETLEKMRNDGRTGRLHTGDSKEKIRKSAINRLKVVCPHCGKVGPINQMKQWHFGRCKVLLKESA